MKEISSLHRQAMVFADLAADAKRKERPEEFLELTRKALDCESQAAWDTADKLDLEPSRSVLFRSAATLAVECGELRQAEKLIGAALSGNTPEEIAIELRDLLEDVYFQRHLEVRGAELSPKEYQMSLNGEATGFGFARSDDVIQRIENFKTLLYRTTERISGEPFHEIGHSKKKTSEDLEVYMSVPRAASFAVTLKFGGKKQLLLPDIIPVNDAVENVLNGIKLINEDNYQALEEHIPDVAYRNNFIALVERLSPDGHNIKTVGFTALHGQEKKIFAITRSKQELRKRLKQVHTKSENVETQEQTEEIQFKGLLLIANAKKPKKGVIEIVNRKEGVTHKISVPRGMMRDIVRPLFDEEVIATCVSRNGKFDLVSIDLAESEN